jgi:hypothetical protein
VRPYQEEKAANRVRVARPAWEQPHDVPPPRKSYAETSFTVFTLRLVSISFTVRSPIPRTGIKRTRTNANAENPRHRAKALFAGVLMSSDDS